MEVGGDWGWDGMVVFVFVIMAWGRFGRGYHYSLTYLLTAWDEYLYSPSHSLFGVRKFHGSKWTLSI